MATGLINLRSDTQSLPTPAMRHAMAVAEVGDDTYGEDPTVRLLEERVADLLGTDAALLVLSGTMANLVALLVHCRPGDLVFADEGSHLLRSEAGGFAHVAGTVIASPGSERGHLRADALAGAVQPRDVHRPRPRLVWLENTANRAGGTTQSVREQRAVLDVAKAHGLVTHLDGARLWNAAAALDRPIQEFAAGLDSLYVDLTKGLGCPAGALLAGSVDLVEEARYRRRVLGGGMRQAGVFAACGLVALDEVLPRLPDDHRRAAQLAAGLAEIEGVELAQDAVETNIVFVDVAGLGGSAAVQDELREQGLIVSVAPPDEIRLCTYLQVDDDDIERAIDTFKHVAARALRGEGAVQRRS